MSHGLHAVSDSSRATWLCDIGPEVQHKKRAVRLTTIQGGKPA